MRKTAIRSPRRSPRRPSPGWRARFAGSSRTRMTGTPGRTHCSARGPAATVWAPSECLYITSFATRSAEVSIFLTPILMPWCCRMSSPSTQRPHGKQSIAWRARSASRLPRQACSTSQLLLARRQRSSLSGCRNGIWTRPLISRCRHPIVIRKRSNATRSALCSTTHFTGAVRRTGEGDLVMQRQLKTGISDVFPELTQDVIGRMRNAASPRLRAVMEILIRHLHAFVRESRLTQEEWGYAIDFLTRTGQICSQQRQEFVLHSDILGGSMLVDAVNHRSGVGILP